MKWFRLLELNRLVGDVDGGDGGDGGWVVVLKQSGKVMGRVAQPDAVSLNVDFHYVCLYVFIAGAAILNLTKFLHKL